MKKRILACAAALALFTLPITANAQGIVRAAAEDAHVGNKAAGPLGGAVGGVVGGVTGGVKGVVGIPQKVGVPRYSKRHYSRRHYGHRRHG